MRLCRTDSRVARVVASGQHSKMLHRMLASTRINETADPHRTRLRVEALGLTLSLACAQLLAKTDAQHSDQRHTPSTYHSTYEAHSTEQTCSEPCCWHAQSADQDIRAHSIRGSCFRDRSPRTEVTCRESATLSFSACAPWGAAYGHCHAPSPLPIRGGVWEPPPCAIAPPFAERGRTRRPSRPWRRLRLLRAQRLRSGRGRGSPSRHTPDPAVWRRCPRTLRERSRRCGAQASAARPRAGSMTNGADPTDSTGGGWHHP